MYAKDISILRYIYLSTDLERYKYPLMYVYPSGESGELVYDHKAKQLLYILSYIFMGARLFVIITEEWLPIKFIMNKWIS